MPFSVTDIAKDFDLIQHVESVSYQQRDQSGAVTATYTGVKAFKSKTIGELAGVGGSAQVLVDHASWEIKAATLPVSVRRGDRIVSLVYGTWEVLSDDLEAYGTIAVAKTKKVSS